MHKPLKKINGTGHHTEAKRWSGREDRIF